MEDQIIKTEKIIKQIKYSYVKAKITYKDDQVVEKKQNSYCIII